MGGTSNGGKGASQLCNHSTNCCQGLVYLDSVAGALEKPLILTNSRARCSSSGKPWREWVNVKHSVCCCSSVQTAHTGYYRVFANTTASWRKQEDCYKYLWASGSGGTATGVTASDAKSNNTARMCQSGACLWTWLPVVPGKKVSFSGGMYITSCTHALKVRPS